VRLTCFQLFRFAENYCSWRAQLISVQTWRPQVRIQDRDKRTSVRSILHDTIRQEQVAQRHQLALDNEEPVPVPLRESRADDGFARKRANQLFRSFGQRQHVRDSRRCTCDKSQHVPSRSSNGVIADSSQGKKSDRSLKTMSTTRKLCVCWELDVRLKKTVLLQVLSP